MFYFSLVLVVLVWGCRDAVISYSRFSPSWYSADEDVPLNPAPPEDLPLGSGVAPRPDQPGAGACPCTAEVCGALLAALPQPQSGTAAALTQRSRDSGPTVLQHVNA